MYKEELSSLDKMVAEKEGFSLSPDGENFITSSGFVVSKVEHWKPTLNWAVADPIIKRVGIKFKPLDSSGVDKWVAYCNGTEASGETRLIAAMKCFIKL